MSLSLYRKKKRYKVDLPAQLVECELNYHRLLRLFRGVKTLAVGKCRQYIVGGHRQTESNFRITILEQTKYTTVVHIAQLFPLQKPFTFIKNSKLSASRHLQPMLTPVPTKATATIYQGDVRLYHDASVAEVVKCQRYQSFSPRYEYPNVDMHQVDEKAQMNRFLGELLSHCLSHGRMADKVIFSS